RRAIPRAGRCDVWRSCRRALRRRDGRSENPRRKGRRARADPESCMNVTPPVQSSILQATERAFPFGPPILELSSISLRFGGVQALTNISFNVLEHEIRAIIGRNGAGNSSMLNVINGIYVPQEGSVTFRGERLSE